LTAAAARAVTYSAVTVLALAALAPIPSGSWRHRPAAGVPVPERSHPSDQSSAQTDVIRLPPMIVTGGPVLDTIVVAGRIWSNLYAALDSGASSALPQRARWQLAWLVADVFEYRVDMSRDLHPGDGFRVLFERTTGPGVGVKVTHVLATTMVLSGDTLTAVRFVRPASAGGAGDYFDPRGRSMRAAFLRAPLEFRRISSTYGRRLHPILGEWRDHKGTDYAAPLGTPVRAIGDGVVLFAGRKGGYGNVVEIRHRNGFVTRYGHLLRFAAGTRAGARVAIGTTIAYVGMTGLATGPHLHFEVLVGGVARDPRVALRDRGAGEPVPGVDRPAFDRTERQLLDALARRPAPVDLAAR
jgi:murein DD-endopeptidase MepM/ murein hydrolase activator NlpD